MFSYLFLNLTRPSSDPAHTPTGNRLDEGISFCVENSLPIVAGLWCCTPESRPIKAAPRPVYRPGLCEAAVCRRARARYDNTYMTRPLNFGAVHVHHRVSAYPRAWLVEKKRVEWRSRQGSREFLSSEVYVSHQTRFPSGSARSTDIKSIRPGEIPHSLLQCADARWVEHFGRPLADASAVVPRPQQEVELFLVHRTADHSSNTFAVSISRREK